MTKINPRRLHTMISHVLTKKKQTTPKKDELLNKQQLQRQFFAWRNESNLNKKPLRDSFKINGAELQLLVDKALLSNMSYEGFISSHLQHDEANVQSELQLKRTLAIKKMQTLVLETVKEMDMIDLQHISRKQG